MHYRVGPDRSGEVSPPAHDHLNVVKQHAGAAKRCKRRICAELDDRHIVACPILGERLDVAMLLAHNASRNGQGCGLGEAVAAQQRVDERPAHAPVAIGERMDGLEVSVHHHCLNEHRDVGAIHELAQIVDGIRDESSSRRHKGGRGRPGGIAADPDRFCPPLPGQYRMRVDQECAVNVENCV